MNCSFINSRWDSLRNKSYKKASDVPYNLQLDLPLLCHILCKIDEQACLTYLTKMYVWSQYSRTASAMQFDIHVVSCLLKQNLWISTWSMGTSYILWVSYLFFGLTYFISFFFSCSFFQWIKKFWTYIWFPHYKYLYRYIAEYDSNDDVPHLFKFHHNWEELHTKYNSTCIYCHRGELRMYKLKQAWYNKHLLRFYSFLTSVWRHHPFQLHCVLSQNMCL